ncbi:MAG: hypothetical protein QW240_07585 [Candidatus Caldarchaeum sp.]
MPCPRCKSDNFVMVGDEFECMSCGFKWRSAARPDREKAEPVKRIGFPRFLLSTAFGLALYLAMGLGYSLLLTFTRTYTTPFGGHDNIFSVVLTLLIFSSTLIAMLAVGPVIAAVIGSVIGMRHRGEGLKAAAASLLASILGYLLLLGIFVASLAALLPQPTPPDQTPSADLRTQPVGPDILLFIIPQAIVGSLTATIVSRAVKG